MTGSMCVGVYFMLFLVCVYSLSSKQQQGSCYHTKESSWGNPSKAASDIIIARRWHGSSLRVRGEMEIKKGFCTWEKSSEWAKMGIIRKSRGRNSEEKKGIDGGLTKGWCGSWCLCCAMLGRAVLGCAWCNTDCWAQTVTHMTRLMRASPYYSSLCGAATLSSVTMKCKAAVAKRANYKDGQSTYAPQSWQLDISIHHSEWMRGGRDERRGRGGKGGEKKEKQNAVFPSIILLYLAHTVVVLYKMPLTRVVGFASDS